MINDHSGILRIGTALKTIIARFQQMKVDPTGTLEDGQSVNAVEEALKSVGVSLRDTNGEFRNLQDVLNDLGGTWESLTRNQKSYIANMAAGQRQQSRFMAIMNNYDRTLELVRTSQNSLGEAMAQYSIYADSLEARQARLTNETEKFHNALVSSNALEVYYKALLGLVELGNKLGPVLTFLGLATAGLSVAFIFKTGVVKQDTIAQVMNNEVQWRSQGLLLGTISKLGAVIPLWNAKAGAILTADQAMKKFKVSSALATAGITVIIGLLVLFIQNLLDTNKQLKESTYEFQRIAEESRKSASNLNVLIKRYDELRKKINLTVSEQEELASVSKEISDLAPSLIAGLDEEGNVRLRNIELLQKELKLKMEVAEQDARNAYRAQKEEVLQGNIFDEENLSEESKSMKKGIKNIYDDLAIYSESLNSQDYITLDNNFLLSDEGPHGFGEPFVNPFEKNKQLTEDFEKGLISQAELQKEIIKIDPIQLGLEEGTEDYDEFLQNQKEGLEQYYKAISTFHEQLILDAKNRVVPYLTTIADSMISQSETDIPNELKGMIKLASYNITEEIVDSMEGQPVEDIIHEIQTESLDILEKIMNDFDIFSQDSANVKRIEEIAEMFASGLSPASIREKIDSLSGSEDMKNLITDYYIDEKEIERQVETVAEIIGNNLTSDEIQRQVESFSSSLGSFLFSGLDNINEEDFADLKKGLTKQIFDLANDKEALKEFEEMFSNVDFTSPTSLASFEEFLIDTFGIKPENIAEVMDSFLLTSLDSVETFLEKAKETMEEVKQLNDDIQKSAQGLTMSDAQGMMQKYGGSAVQNVGENFFLSGEAVEQQRRALNESIMQEQTEAYNRINNEITEIVNTNEKLTSEHLKQINNLERMRDATSKILAEIIKVSDIERARIDNQTVLTGLMATSSSVNSLRELGSVYTQLTQDGLTFLETVEAVAQNPDLLVALELVNGQLQLTTDGLMMVAEKKKEETVAHLKGEKAKMDAVLMWLDVQLDSTEKMSKAEEEAFDEIMRQMDSEQKGQVDVTNSKIDAMETQIDGIISVADAQYQAHVAFMNQMKAEVEAIRAKNIAMGVETSVQAVAIGKAASITPKDLGTADYTDILANRYGLDSSDAGVLREIRGKVQNEVDKMDALISQLMATSASEMLSHAGGGKRDSGSEKTEDAFETIFGEFDQFFNYLQRLHYLNNKADTLDAKLALRSTSGGEQIRLLSEKAKALEAVADATEQLIERQELALAKTQKDMQSRFGDFVKFSGTEIEVRWDLINALRINSEEEQKWYEAMLGSIDAYDSLNKELKENEKNLLSVAKAREELYKTMFDEVVETRQQIYNALVEMDQREIDSLTKKYSKMKELEDNYVAHIRRSIQQEREMRTRSQQEQDLQQKRRRLSVLESDTSGMFSREAEQLRQEIEGERQQLEDARLDAQLTKLEEQIRIQQEQRDLQIRNLENLIWYREEADLYWQMTDAVIRAGANSIAQVLMSTNEYLSADALKQGEMTTEIQKQAQKLSDIYTLGSGVLSVSDPGMAEALEAGLREIARINGDSTKSINNMMKRVESVAANALSVAQKAQTTASQAKITASKPAPTSTPAPAPTPAKPTVTNTRIINDAYAQTLMQNIKNNKTLSKSQVSELQGYLNQFNLGITKLVVDGLMGPKTREALSRYDSRIRPHLGSSPLMMAYSKGGVVDYTGPAMVHGTKSKPETFLDARQTKLFADMRDELEQSKTVKGLGNQGISNIITLGDINMTFDGTVTSNDARDIAEEVRKTILDTLKGSVNPALQRLR